MPTVRCRARNSNRERETIMIGDYFVVAFVIAIGLSFLGCIHYFWLRDAFREETPLEVPAEKEGKCGISSPSARTFDDCKPGKRKPLRERIPALSQTQVAGRS